jgi:hypothetical protein
MSSRIFVREPLPRHSLSKDQGHALVGGVLRLALAIHA